MSHEVRTLEQRAEAAQEGLPPVPLTLEGSSVLHQMFRVRWPAWNSLDPERRAAIAAEAAGVLEGMEGGRVTVRGVLLDRAQGRPSAAPLPEFV